MKKVKGTKRPAQTGPLVFQPSRLRMFLIYIVLFALAIGLGLLLRAAVNPGGLGPDYLAQNWPSGLLLIVGGAGLLALIERSRWTLRIIDRDVLEGPSGAFGERYTIRIDEIDWERTRRSLSSRVKIGNAIYGPERRRIIISQWFFPPEDLRTLLEAITPRHARG